MQNAKCYGKIQTLFLHFAFIILHCGCKAGVYTMLSSQQSGAVRPIIFTTVGATLARP